jgi:hypothetical protein
MKYLLAGGFVGLLVFDVLVGDQLEANQFLIHHFMCLAPPLLDFLTCCGTCDGFLQNPKYRQIDLFLPPGKFSANRHGAGEVGVVVCIACTHIH